MNKYRLNLFAAVMVALAVFAPPVFGLAHGFVGMGLGQTTTLTDLDAALKIIFDDTLISNAVTESELLSEFEDGGGIKTDVTTGGRYIETSQLFNLPAGFGFRGENGYIPVPSGPLIKNSRITLKKGVATVEMTAESLKRCRSDAGAYIDWGEKAFPTLLQRVKNKIDSMMLGYGNACIARVNAASPATNLVVDSPFGINNLGTAKDALVQFLAGETLRASPNADGSSPRALVMTVNDIDWKNQYLVVDQLATSLADNDYLFGGDSAANDAGFAFTGFFGHVDDGGVLATYQNLARATYSAWRSTVIDAQSVFGTGQTLTEDVVVYADDTGFTQGGAVIDLFVCSRTGVRQLWKDLKGDRSMVDPRSYTGGKGKLFILLGDRLVAVKVARKMPASCAFGITKSTFKKFVLHEFEWDQTTGAIWRQVTDATGRKDAFFAYGSVYMEFGGSDPQKNWRIENIATSGSAGT